jgi:hypothetical protein
MSTTNEVNPMFLKFNVQNIHQLINVNEIQSIRPDGPDMCFLQLRGSWSELHIIESYHSVQKRIQAASRS